MKRSLTALIVAGSICAAIADEPPKPGPGAGAEKKLSPEDRKARLEQFRKENPEAVEHLREDLKNLSPEERQKRVREFREKHGAPVRDEVEKRRDELKKLPPDERQAKMKELREQVAERRKAMTPEDRKAKRLEIKSRFEKQLQELKQKKASGTITSQESKRLARLETIAQRFQQAKENAGAAEPAAR